MDAPFCVKISPLPAIERLIRKNDYRDAAFVRLYLDIFSFIKNFAKKKIKRYLIHMSFAFLQMNQFIIIILQSYVLIQNGCFKKF